MYKKFDGDNHVIDLKQTNFFDIDFSRKPKRRITK